MSPRWMLGQSISGHSISGQSIACLWHCTAAMFFAVAVMVPLNAMAGMIDKQGMADWEICGMCHGANGISAMSKFPILAGQKAKYIEQQVLQFRSGARSNDGGQMQAITTEVELAAVANIAAYFAALPAPPLREIVAEGTEGSALTKQYQRGEKLFREGGAGVPACTGCHANKGSVAPWLDGQHKSYLQKQLSDFKEGQRGDVAQGTMPKIVIGMGVDDIEAVSLYLAFTRFERN